MKKRSTSETSSHPRRPARASGGVKKMATPSPGASRPVKLSRPRKAMQLLEEHFDEPTTCAVVFQYFNPQASEVRLAGSFNGWQPEITPMIPDSDGQWLVEIHLEPGQYEYRLFVDGRWQDDPLAARYVANPFGGLNCVVEVQANGTTAPAPRRV